MMVAGFALKPPPPLAPNAASSLLALAANLLNCNYSTSSQQQKRSSSPAHNVDALPPSKEETEVIEGSLCRPTTVDQQLSRLNRSRAFAFPPW